MNPPWPELWPAFFAELSERLQRAQRILDAAEEVAAFDRLHQEFDTLHGAARAVDCNCLERSNRRLAEYVRQLKRRGASLAEGKPLLLRGIELGMGCATHGRCCDACPSWAMMPQLLAALDEAVGDIA